MYFRCFFFKQKTAYEMRISDWSSYVCSSDLEPARAEPLYREAIAIYRTKMGDDHPWTATGIKNLGELLLKMGDSAGAQAQFSEALRIRKLVYGDTHPLVAEARDGRAHV